MPYQRLTPDPKITSEFKRKDQGKFKYPIPSVYMGPGVYELPLYFSPPDILVYMT